MPSASTTRRHIHFGPQRQRGAIGLWGSLTLLLAILFMALTVDTGRLWMQQRKLQSIADIAAMEAARNMGCNIDLDNVTSAAQTAATRNGYNGQLAQAPNLVELGSITTVSGVRQFIPGTPQEAVHVHVTQSVPASLVVGGLFGNQVELHAEAVAAADPPLVTFTAGTFLASVTTDVSPMNRLLGDLLGTTLNLNAISYEGLATANLTLLNLIQAQGSVSSINELLNTEIPLSNLVNMIVEGVDENGTASSLAMTALEQLASATNNTPVKLADILAVTAPNGDASTDVNLNAFSLITAAALFANENSTIDLSAGLLNATVTITQAPLLAIGPNEGGACTSARTAQLSLNASISAGVASVDLNVDIAPGTAELMSFTDNGNESHVVIAAKPSIAEIDISAKLLGLEVPLAPLPPIGSNVAQDLDFYVEHPTANALPQTMTASTPVGGTLASVLQGLGAPPAVSTLFDSLGTQLLDPLLELLGIRLGGMDVTLHDIQLRQARPLII